MNSANCIDSLLEEASSLLHANQIFESINAYIKIISIDKTVAEAWYNIAFLHRRINKFHEALKYYDLALIHKIDSPAEVHLNCAVILAEDLGQPHDALTELDKALGLDPRFVPALLNMGNIYEQLGNREEAHAAYQRALLIDPQNSLALSRLPNLEIAIKNNYPLIGRIRSALSRPGISEEEKADLGFALGKALDNAADFDNAFDAYVAANMASRNSAQPQFQSYDRQKSENLVDALIKAFPVSNSSIQLASHGPIPIFICGMFRSGSTLIEQILASHDSVVDGGEIDFIPKIAIENLYPALNSSRVEISESKYKEIREKYLDTIAAKLGESTFITDKRPDNFLNIGLIKSVFPESKIIYTSRNALDNCLSIYFLHLSHAMPFAFDLEDIAHWYLLHRKLMGHWKDLYPKDIHEVHYDSLVADFRPNVERLLRHCGLPWDEKCMDFHKTDSLIMTPSAWQVRQPLYRRSSGRWRHYQHRLEKLATALGDTER